MDPVLKYFYGERAESYLFLLLGVVSMGMAFRFLIGLQTSFWKGVAIPFFIVATLELIVGYTIVNRSPKDIVRVETYLKSEPIKIQELEIPRMNDVMSNFRLFRYIEISLIFVGMALMYHSKEDTLWRGIGLGLFIQSSIVLCLDFFAERRGEEYLGYLLKLIAKSN